MTIAYKTGHVTYSRKGDRGQIPYPAGMYSDNVTYEATSQTAPFVLYQPDINHPPVRYIMNKIGKWLGKEKKSNPQKDYAENGNNATWIPFKNYKFFETEIALIHLGLIGASVFWDNYTFSKYGIDSGGNPLTSPDSYKNFDPSKLGQPNCPFTPNLYIDWLNGTLNALNANISGTIKTKEGYIGNYKIDKYGLTSNYNNTGNSPNDKSSGYMTLNSSFIKFYEENKDGLVNVIIGSRALSNVVSVSQCPIYVNAKNKTDGIFAVEPTLCMYLSASGSRNNDDDATSGNHALFIPKGDICGLRKRTRRIKNNTNGIKGLSVSVMDSNIIAITSHRKDIRLNLPSDAEDGQEYTFIHTGAGGWLYVTAPYGQSVNHNGDIQSEHISKTSEMCFLIFDKFNKVWFMTYF